MIEIVNRETGQIMDSDSVPGLAEIAALHDRRLSELQDALTDLVEDPPVARGPGSRPFVWQELSPRDRARTWQALAEWVGWLRGRYPLARQVPLCWWRHPELVEELTALWLAWREAYVEKGAPLTSAADWHGRWLPELLRRMRAGGWNVACESEHKPAVAALYDPRSVDDPTEFHHALGARLPDRPEGDLMDDTQMQSAIAHGEARRLGDLPGAPVALDGRYWQPTNSGWEPVESDETVAFLADAERRLRLAGLAIDQADRQ